MSTLVLYLDECFDQHVVGPLRERGYALLTVQQTQTRELTDEAQLNFAAAHGCLLFSHHQIHFRRLHTRWRREGREHAGIALIPQTVPLSRLVVRVVLLLEWIGTFPNHKSDLFRWGDLQQRLIHGYRVPGSALGETQVRHALGWSPSAS